MDAWLAWALGAAALVVVLVVADRLTAAGLFDRRDRRPRERRPGGTPVGSAMGSVLDFYDPSHRHLTEEQQREKSWTEQAPGEAPPLIDLESGVADLTGGETSGGPVSPSTPPSHRSAPRGTPSPGPRPPRPARPRRS